MIIKLLIEGGDMKPGPAIAQKLGPIGINIGKVISDINIATGNFKGLKVPVELDVDAKSKTFKVEVFSPPVSELLKKELGVDKGAAAAKKLKAGNLAIEQIIKVAKTKHPNMLSKTLKSAVKAVAGSCVALGVLIENKEAKDIEKDIDSGKYDDEIKNEKIQVSQEKLKELKEFFTSVRKKQEEIIKKEEEAKAAEEATKAAAAPAAGTAPVAGEKAAPAVAGEKTAAPAAGAKAEEKPAKPVKPRKTNNQIYEFFKAYVEIFQHRNHRLQYFRGKIKKRQQDKQGYPFQGKSPR